MSAIDKYVNLEELAQYLGMSRTAVYKFAKEGKLPQGIKIGDCRRWNLDEVKEFLKNGHGHI